MNSAARIASVYSSAQINTNLYGIDHFKLSSLGLANLPAIELPDNLRLGHLVERIVAGLINVSDQYQILHENFQLIENGNTLGELDFILLEQATEQVIHLEMAYKFYLLDPSYSKDQNKNWIGPNRNDSLIQKLEKLEHKQFPLLQHPLVKEAAKNLANQPIKQALCLMASLYLPINYKHSINDKFQQAIKGYYIDLEHFNSLDHSNSLYFLPTRTAWGIDPKINKEWLTVDEVKPHISVSLAQNKSPLCWQKKDDEYSEFFITWW